MRRAVLAGAAAVLLLGPTALAFFSGGYFEQPRLWAALVTWLVVLAATVLAPAPLPSGRAGRAAVAGLALLTAWSALSVTWAPLVGPALDDVERLLLYLGALVAAIAVLRRAAVAAAVEPVLAAGGVLVLGYGLAGRLLPGVVHEAHSWRAGTRLDQPLTYWNAEGALAAIALVLCAHLAAGAIRRRPTRVAAAAAAAPLAMGIYLSFSRGAIVAAAVGLIVLLAAAPTRPQLRAVLSALVAGCTAAAVASASGGVASLAGTASVQRRDGAVVLAVLLAVMAVAALLADRWVVRERSGRLATGRLPGARRFAAAAAVAAGLGLAGVVVGGLAERGNGTELTSRSGVERLTSVQSNRYEYWRVGARAFVHHPLAGLGTAGFRSAWLQERTITEGVRDAHSIELETAAELGLVGLAGLALLLGGVATAARRAVRRRPDLAVGWCGACAVWLVHASIDWDWEMPAVTLPVLLLVGALIAAAEGDPGPAPPRQTPATTGPRRLPEPPPAQPEGRPLEPVHRLRSPPSPSRGPVP